MKPEARMKLLPIISVNTEKFMEFSVPEFVELMKQHGVYGVEIHADCDNGEQMNYSADVLAAIRAYDMRFLVHADSELTLESQLPLLKMVSDGDNNGLGFVTFHPVYDDDVEESKRKTVEYLRRVTDFAKSKKMTVLLENLNDYDSQHRLKAEEILPIIEENSTLGMTYDIGHVICDGANKVEDFVLTPEIIKRTKNLHIHDSKEGIDHLPIRLDSDKLDLMMDVVKHFTEAETIVFEYDLYQCKGKTVREQILDYFDSISIFMKMLREHGVIE